MEHVLSVQSARRFPRYLNCALTKSQSRSSCRVRKFCLGSMCCQSMEVERLGAGRCCPPQYHPGYYHWHIWVPISFLYIAHNAERACIKKPLSDSVTTPCKWLQMQCSDSCRRVKLLLVFVISSVCAAGRLWERWASRVFFPGVKGRQWK